MPWTDYVRGAAKVLVDDGIDLAGFDGLLHSTVPFGSGLSSSAAIELVVLLAFAHVSGIELEPLELALLGQRVENEFVGVACGILDQYTSVLGTAGHALLLDCRSLTSEPVSISEELAIVICDTRAPRQLSGSEYDERRAQCEAGAAHILGLGPREARLRDVSLSLFEAHEAELDPVVARRCRFIIEENQRVLDLAEPLRSGDREALRQPLRRLLARCQRPLRDRGALDAGHARFHDRRSRPHRTAPGRCRVRRLPRGHRGPLRPR